MRYTAYSRRTCSILEISSSLLLFSMIWVDIDFSIKRMFHTCSLIVITRSLPRPRGLSRYYISLFRQFSLALIIANGGLHFSRLWALVILFPVSDVLWINHVSRAVKRNCNLLTISITSRKFAPFFLITQISRVLRGKSYFIPGDYFRRLSSTGNFWPILHLRQLLQPLQWTIRSFTANLI